MIRLFITNAFTLIFILLIPAVLFKVLTGIPPHDNLVVFIVEASLLLAIQPTRFGIELRSVYEQED